MNIEASIRSARAVILDSGAVGGEPGDEQIVREAIERLAEQHSPLELLATVIELQSASRSALAAAFQRLEVHRSHVDALLVIFKTQLELDRKIARLASQVMPEIQEGGE